jgi:hypothetical protein
MLLITPAPFPVPHFVGLLSSDLGCTKNVEARILTLVTILLRLRLSEIMPEHYSDTTQLVKEFIAL